MTNRLKNAVLKKDFRQAAKARRRSDASFMELAGIGLGGFIIRYGTPVTRARYRLAAFEHNTSHVVWPWGGDLSPFGDILQAL